MKSEVELLNYIWYLPDSQFLTFWIDWPILICKIAALRFKIGKPHSITAFHNLHNLRHLALINLIILTVLWFQRSRCFFSSPMQWTQRIIPAPKPTEDARLTYLRTVNSKSFRTFEFILEYPLGILEYPTPVTFLYSKIANITLFKLTLSNEEVDSDWSYLSPQSTAWMRDFCNFYNRVRRDILRQSWQEISPVQEELSVCVQSGSAVLFQSKYETHHLYFHK